MLYAQSTGGFYSHDIHGSNMPADAVELTDADYQNLIDGQSHGKRILSDESGKPVLQDPPQLTQDQIKQQGVAALLAGHGETRLTIQAALMSLETAAAVQKIPLDALYARNKTYKVCKDIETACQAIEKS